MVARGTCAITVGEAGWRGFAAWFDVVVFAGAACAGEIVSAVTASGGCVRRYGEPIIRQASTIAMPATALTAIGRYRGRGMSLIREMREVMEPSDAVASRRFGVRRIGEWPRDDGMWAMATSIGSADSHVVAPQRHDGCGAITSMQYVHSVAQ
ncbi:hypothetical protein C6V08_33415 [Burkholderia gladioli]|nr:hypothetical protein C6V08_33415 [Burkholderia gladioli]